MKKIIAVFLFLGMCFFALAGTITGTILTTKGEVLPYASITVKNTGKGAIANSQGRYSLTLEAGNYTLLCQYVGYKAEEKKVTVGGDNTILDFTLSVQELAMQEVIIKRGEDPAIAIMRQAIAKRDFYNRQVDSFSVEVYIKGLLRSRGLPQKFLGQKIDRKELAQEGIDSAGKGILFLSESRTKVSFSQPGKIKYEVLSSRESGGGYGLSFPFFINFYSTNVSVFNNRLNPRGFISPLADGAFHYYQFKYEGNFFEGTKMIDRIKVTPRRKNEPLFAGYIQIVDGEWRIHSLELTTTSSYGLELLDTIKVTQMQAPVTADIWRTQNQVLYVAVKKFGFDIAGNFLNVYSHYNFAPGFGKKYFNRVIMSYDTTFNKKDTAYWNAIRPVALEPDEKRNFVFKDSANKVLRDSMYSKRNIDSLRRHRPSIQLKHFFVQGINRTFYSSKNFTVYTFEPLLKNLEYNTVEGLAITATQALKFSPRKGRNTITLGAVARYGISNRHFNGYGTLSFQPNRRDVGNRLLQLGGGKRISQINRENPIDPFINSLYTLLAKKNYIKLYEAWFGEVSYSGKTESGFRWRGTISYEDRIPLENASDFSFFKKSNVFLPNHPYELAAVPFNRQQAFVTSLVVSFQPGQRYIQFPYRRQAIGSNYPTFEVQYAKGIKGPFGSDADFDKWKFSVYDNVNLKIGGEFRYRFSVGGFFNNRSVGLPDYQHFNGNQTFYNSMYVNSFQLAPYYRYSNIEPFYIQAHAEHHFNGLLTNKIPLFNKLKWNLVAGSNTFYVNRTNYYAEAFAGLENILKLFRVDFITAYQAQPGNVFGVRIGTGGLIGGAVQRSR